VNYVQNYQSAIDQRSLPPTTNTTTATSSSTSESNSKYLSRSSTLPTLHEEGDGGIVEGSESFGCAVGGFSESSNRVPTLSSGSSSSKVPMSLTKDALMATQRRRLEMRPSG
jgi:axin 1